MLTMDYLESDKMNKNTNFLLIDKFLDWVNKYEEDFFILLKIP